MGRYYAERSGESAALVQAMDEHYLPRHAGDRLPSGASGRAVALADRLDTLVGIFAIGQRPTGVKDPYGLRRAAIGVLRILIETPLPLDLRALLRQAADCYAGVVDTGDSDTAVFEYVMERLHGYYAERGVAADSVAAVLALTPSVPSDIDRRIAAVEAFRALPEAAALAAANKRIRNILRKAPPADLGAEVRSEQLQQDSERALAARIGEARGTVAPLTEARDYKGILLALAELRPEVDRFFDDVMVMTEAVDLRRNRLGLLRELEALFLGVADVSLLHQQGTDA
jgi:glycyl-tRNA synthetase beta chain